MCSPGDHGWVIAGEIWPGQVLSFLRDPINASRWRDVKARPCYYIAKGQNNGLLLIEQHSSWSGWLVTSLRDLGHKILLCRFCSMRSSLVAMPLHLQLSRCTAMLLLSTAGLQPAPPFAWCLVWSIHTSQQTGHRAPK